MENFKKIEPEFTNSAKRYELEDADLPEIKDSTTSGLRKCADLFWKIKAESRFR
jgi:hypothetical protein